VADALVSTGLRDVGYRFVNIDDCWMAPKRSEDGHLRPHPQRFPSGMKALGDYIHARGLKFGIYSCAGHMTCEGWPASFGHERTDAADWASWGVDYLKYDFCGLEKVPANQKEPRQLYSVMRDALNATGRPVVFSLCNWGVGQPHLWGHDVGNSWRTGRDVFAVWDEHAARAVHKLPGYLQSIMTAIEDADRARRTVDGPGGFNDPDMLVVGLQGMTPCTLSGLRASRAHLRARPSRARCEHMHMHHMPPPLRVLLGP
jgi:alpha-galactosidase